MLPRPKRGFEAAWRGMKKIDIFDSLFTNSISMAGDKHDFKPKLFEWEKDPTDPRSPLFFTESHLDRVSYFSDDFDCYLILIEPEALHPQNYQRALELEDRFDGIFTHDGRYVSDIAARNKWHFYTFGGSWIVNPEITKKILNVGMIASHKKSLPGHKLRHKIARHYAGFTSRYPMFIPNVWGSGYKSFDSKRRILADYRFMVIIENVRQDYWFTEKLLDTLSMGCIPIYWGCPSIDRFFNTDGIIQFETYGELVAILRDLDFENEYESRTNAIEENAMLARRYFICEDVMAKSYPDIFRLDDE